MSQMLHIAVAGAPHVGRSLLYYPQPPHVHNVMQVALLGALDMGRLLCALQTCHVECLIFWYFPGAAGSGFKCRLTLPVSSNHIFFKQLICDCCPGGTSRGSKCWQILPVFLKHSSHIILTLSLLLRLRWWVLQMLANPPWSMCCPAVCLRSVTTLSPPAASRWAISSLMVIAIRYKLSVMQHMSYSCNVNGWREHCMIMVILQCAVTEANMFRRR